jgi:hypothetical protein
VPAMTIPWDKQGMQYQEYGTEACITLAPRKKARLETVYTVHQDAPFLCYFFKLFYDGSFGSSHYSMVACVKNQKPYGECHVPFNSGFCR